MKKVVVALMLLTGLSVMAQKGPHHEGKRMAMQDMTTEQIATLKTKKMTLALDLSKEQQQEIQKLNLENAEARKASVEDHFKMRSERLDRAIAQKEKMKEILDAEQFAKWEKMHAKRKQHRKGKGKGERGKR